jgi:hypothetical protein
VRLLCGLLCGRLLQLGQKLRFHAVFGVDFVVRFDVRFSRFSQISLSVF